MVPRTAAVVALLALLCFPGGSALLLPRLRPGRIAAALLRTRGGMSPSARREQLKAATFGDDAFKSMDDGEFEKRSSPVLDAVMLTQKAQDIILQWAPTRRDLWRRWQGTVLQSTLPACIALTLVSFTLCMTTGQTGIMEVFKESMARLDKLWHMQMTLSSFFLAFYLNGAKALFDNVMSVTRKIQGRLNDLSLLAASHAKRDADGKMVPQAEEICATLGRYIRLFTVLFYSAQSRRYQCILGERGLRGLQTRGLVTGQEVDILLTLQPKARYNAVYTWMMSTFTRGVETPEPCFRMATNVHFAFAAKMAELRGTCATVGDLLDGRCPLAYVHFVQLLVDTFLLMTPFAAFADMGWFSIAGTFVLTLFFSGLLDLAKMLYDPLDNETYSADADPIQVDTLIQEQNDASTRFLATGLHLPENARPE